MKRKNKKDASPGLYERIYEARLSQRVADAEDEARRMEAYERTVHNRQSRRALRAFAAFVLIFALFAAAAFIAYKLLFVISDISVEGNTTYTADEIIAASGVKSGDNLYSFSSRTAERLMKKVSVCEISEGGTRYSEQDKVHRGGRKGGICRADIREIFHPFGGALRA